jgi:type II secretory pathway component PulM
MNALSPRDRRTLWIGALIVVPVLAWRVVVSPLATARATHAERAELAAGLLAREQALLRDGPRLPVLLDSARRQLDVESASLFAVDDTAAAVRALVTALRTSARAAGLDDVSVESAALPRVTGVVVEVQADVRAHGSTAALAAWLARLDGGERVLPVDRLDLFADGDGRLAIGARVRGFARMVTP